MPTLDNNERLLAGFILHKLWTYRYWCGEGRRQHLGHTALTNLAKGRDRRDAGSIFSVAGKLRRLGFINIFTATGDKHVCASRSPDILKRGLILINEYRLSVNLPALTDIRDL